MELLVAQGLGLTLLSIPWVVTVKLQESVREKTDGRQATPVEMKALKQSEADN